MLIGSMREYVVHKWCAGERPMGMRHPGAADGMDCGTAGTRGRHLAPSSNQGGGGVRKSGDCSGDDWHRPTISHLITSPCTATHDA